MKKITAFLITLFCIATLFIGTSCSPEDNGPAQYAITMANDGNGMAMASVNGEMVLKAETGATVTITALAAEGYLFDKWVVVSGGVTLTGDVANIQTFVMPANKVSIKAEFKAIPVQYAITMTNDGNGMAMASVNGEMVLKAEAGATVTITALAAEGYVFDKWVVVSGGVTLTGDIVNIQTFVMPANEVSIKAEFKAIPDDIFLYITDPKFKEYCKKYDINGNNKLSYVEAQEVIIVSVSGLNIASLSGIEYFTSLTHLYCFTNQLTSLDVSKNTKLTYLNCNANKLESLDVSKNTELTTLQCVTNQLGILDVSKNTKLTELQCSRNQLESLDVSESTALTKLYCFTNQLTSLDVSKSTALTHLYCYDNINLTKIFVWSSFDIDNPSSSITNINKDPQAVFEKK